MGGCFCAYDGAVDAVGEPAPQTLYGAAPRRATRFIASPGELAKPLVRSASAAAFRSMPNCNSVK